MQGVLCQKSSSVYHWNWLWPLKFKVELYSEAVFVKAGKLWGGSGT